MTKKKKKVLLLKGFIVLSFYDSYNLYISIYVPSTNENIHVRKTKEYRD